MSETLANNWRVILGTTAGVALVFGISWLLFSSNQEKIVPDSNSDIIERDTFRVNPENAPSGAGTPQGPVIISPATLSVENAAPGLRLPTINVQNQSSEPRKVRIDFAPFYRTTSQGVPVILSDEDNLARGASYLQLQPQGEVVIPPESNLPVTATLKATPPEPTLTGSIGVTLLGKPGPLSDPEKGGVRTRVEQNVRLSALLYAVFPGGSSREYRVENLYAEPKGDEQGLRVVVEMRSEGDLPNQAQGEVLLRSSEGGRTLRRTLPPVTVLPGQRATSSTEAFRGLKPGRYQITARVNDGKSGQALSRSLLVNSKGLPAVPEAAARFTISPRQAKPRDDVQLNLQVANSGEKSFSPEVAISLYGADAQKPQASQDLTLAPVSPGQQEGRELTLRAPARTGEYIYTATIANQSGEILEERSVGLLVSKERSPEISLPDRARDWLSDNPGGALAIGSLVTGLVLLIALGFLHLRSRKRTK